MFHTSIHISNQNTMYIGEALKYLTFLPSTQLFPTQKDSLKQFNTYLVLGRDKSYFVKNHSK
jgi:hypothetical protein